MRQSDAACHYINPGLYESVNDRRLFIISLRKFHRQITLFGFYCANQLTNNTKTAGFHLKRNISFCLYVRWCMFVCVDVCRCLLMYVCVCWCLSASVGVCLCALVLVGVCWRVLTRASRIIFSVTSLKILYPGDGVFPSLPLGSSSNEELPVLNFAKRKNLWNCFNIYVTFSKY